MMTLILVYAFPEMILMAADRRISRLEPGASIVSVVYDERNKLVVLGNAAVFGYTGLAGIGHDARTDYLLQEAIEKAQNVGDAFRKLRAAATMEFWSLGRTNPGLDTRHAFLAGAWSKSQPDGRLRPGICFISNALVNGKWFSPPRRSFEIGTEILPDGAVYLMGQVGIQLTEAEKDDVEREIVRALSAGLGFDGIAHILVAAIRRVADRNDGVGRSIQVVALPRPTGTGPGFVARLDGKFDDAAPSALYFPGGNNAPVLYAPHFVGGGGSVRDIRVWTEP
jgi:hypothetical protein